MKKLLISAILLVTFNVSANICELQPVEYESYPTYWRVRADLLYNGTPIVEGTSSKFVNRSKNVVADLYDLSAIRDRFVKEGICTIPESTTDMCSVKNFPATSNTTAATALSFNKLEIIRWSTNQIDISEGLISSIRIIKEQKLCNLVDFAPLDCGSSDHLGQFWVTINGSKYLTDKSKTEQLELEELGICKFSELDD